MQIDTKEIILAGIFLALCLVLPILFHGIGLGMVFLPLLFPIAMAAFFLRPQIALTVGLLAPIISAALTGMPPLSPPIAQVMMAEGCILGWLTALLNKRLQLGIIIPLLLGIIASRTILFAFNGLLAPLFGLPAKAFSIATVLAGLPGNGLQLLLIPLLVNRIKKQKIIDLTKFDRGTS